MNYYDRIDNLAQVIIDGESLKHKHSIIIGKNAIGKSDVVLNIIKSNDKKVYYIDSANRKYDTKSIMNESIKEITVDEIVKNRIRKEIFNQQDSFGNASRKIEMISYRYKDKLKELLGEFLGVDFEIQAEKSEFGDEYVVFVDGKRVDSESYRLSDGYQAIIRILIEILFYSEQFEEDEMFILIDEIDTYLSVNYKYDILCYLENKFPQLRFVVTTHSKEVLLGTANSNIIALGQMNYEIYDSNDVDSDFMIENIFKHADLLNDEIQTNTIESKLRVLLNHRVYGIWSEIDNSEFDEIEYDMLSPMNQYIYKTIQRWSDE